MDPQAKDRIVSKPSSEPLPRPGHLRWWVLAWPLAAGTVNYMDRMGVSIAAPALIKEFGFSRTDIGLMGTVFSWSYAIAQLPSGWLVDRFGARVLYSGAIGAWSLATALMAGGARLWHFLLFRLMLGIAEAPNGPASAKMTAEWFPRIERGQASAIWDSGSKWGPALAPPILTALLIHFGWRSIFLFLGLTGIALALAMFTFYRSPEKNARLGAAERFYIQAGRDNDNLSGSSVPWGELFKHRQTWGMMLGYFCIIWVWNIFIVFLPLYLQEARGVSIQSSGLLAAIPYLGAAILGILGGYAMTQYTKKKACAPLTGKRHIISVAALGAGLAVILIPFVPSVELTICTMTIALGLIATMTAAAWAIPGDVVDSSRVASIGAIQNFGGYFGGAFAPLLTGMIADRTGSYTFSFVVAGVIASLAAIAYSTLVRREILP